MYNTLFIVYKLDLTDANKFTTNSLLDLLTQILSIIQLYSWQSCQKYNKVRYHIILITMSTFRCFTDQFRLTGNLHELTLFFYVNLKKLVYQVQLDCLQRCTRGASGSYQDIDVGIQLNQIFSNVNKILTKELFI